MSSSPLEQFDVVVVGAGPAGVAAALRAAHLGVTTALITRDEFGGMAANDGPVPVRTLARAARLIREAGQLPCYGIAGGEPSLDYQLLLARVREVTAAVLSMSEVICVADLGFRARVQRTSGSEGVANPLALRSLWSVLVCTAAGMSVWLMSRWRWSAVC